MRALLILTCLFNTVPSAEALPSLPSISSSTGIAMAVVSVAVALALVVGLAFMSWKKLKGLTIMEIFGKIKNKPATKENVETGQIDPHERREPWKLAHIVELKPVNETFEQAFDRFLQEWNHNSFTEKEDFIDMMVKEFPVAVTPAMVMDTLHKMLSAEVNVDLWMQMLRFIMKLERDLHRWDNHDDIHNRIMPKDIYYEFRSFLVKQADAILENVGKVAKPNEGEDAGFMRFIAYLFAFATKEFRIIEIMEETWTRLGFAQTDASRAMVWGYARWMENHDDEGEDEVFSKLMQELRATAPEPGVAVGSKAQHLLFALGCGDEPDWTRGPLAAMCHGDRHEMAALFESKDYLWLMMARHFVMGNAWQWMCKKELSEHNRMCNRFGQKGDLYDIIVDMVMKYDEEQCPEGEESMAIIATRYSSGAKYKINFAEHRHWYDRYHREKAYIGRSIWEWLLKNAHAETEESKMRRAEAEIRKNEK